MRVAGPRSRNHMDRTFPWRLAAGLSVLGLLIIRDLRKPIRSYERLKEYGFLFGTAALAIGYGMVHDRITYAISREYYVIGKGLASAANGFNRDVAMLAAQASWSAGLFIGLTFLIANRPQQRVGQLPYRTLITLLVIPLLGSIATACALGAVGFFFAAPLSARFELHYLGLRAPALFCATWGFILGLISAHWEASWRATFASDGFDRTTPHASDRSLTRRAMPGWSPAQRTSADRACGPMLMDVERGLDTLHALRSRCAVPRSLAIEC